MGAHPYSLKLKMSHLRSTEWERSSLGCIWRGRWTAFNHNLIIRCWGWCVSRSVFVWCVWCGVTKCLACNHWTVSHFFLSWTPHYTYNALRTCDVIKITEHTYFSQFDVTYDQVWGPILGICALRLTHPKYTQQWTQTQREHTPGAVGSHLCCGIWGAVGSSVSCSRAPRRGIVVLKVEKALYIHSPHLQFLPAYSLTLRPRLPVLCL